MTLWYVEYHHPMPTPSSVVIWGYDIYPGKQADAYARTIELASVVQVLCADCPLSSRLHCPV